MQQSDQNHGESFHANWCATLLRAYRFNLLYATELVRYLSARQMCQSLGPGLENHPAFTLGHLVIASALMLEDLGEAYCVPDGWDDLFRRTGPGDPKTPHTSTSAYPTKETLLTELQNKRRALEKRVRTISPESLQQPIGWRFDRYFPTVFDLLIFMCITHEAMHLAQVAAWPRAAGLESALARL